MEGDFRCTNFFVATPPPRPATKPLIQNVLVGGKGGATASAEHQTGRSRRASPTLNACPTHTPWPPQWPMMMTGQEGPRTPGLAAAPGSTLAEGGVDVIPDSKTLRGLVGCGTCLAPIGAVSTVGMPGVGENKCRGGGGSSPFSNPPPLWQGLFGQAAKKGPFSHTPPLEGGALWDRP